MCVLEFTVRALKETPQDKPHVLVSCNMQFVTLLCMLIKFRPNNYYLCSRKTGMLPACDVASTHSMGFARALAHTACFQRQRILVGTRLARPLHHWQTATQQQSNSAGVKNNNN